MSPHNHVSAFETACFLYEFSSAENILDDLVIETPSSSLVTVLRGLLLHRQNKHRDAIDTIHPIVCEYSTSDQVHALARMLYSKIIIIDDEEDALQTAEWARKEVEGLKGTSEGLDMIVIVAEITYCETQARFLQYADSLSDTQRETLRSDIRNRARGLRDKCFENGEYGCLGKILAIPALPGVGTTIAELEEWTEDSLALLTKITSTIREQMKGMLHLTLAEQYLRTEETKFLLRTEERLNLAGLIFWENGWKYGDLRVRKARLTHAQLDGSVSAERIFDELSDLAVRFKQQGCYGDYIKCLIDQILTMQEEQPVRTNAVFTEIHEYLNDTRAQQFFTLQLLQMETGIMLKEDGTADGAVLRACEQTLDTLDRSAGLTSRFIQAQAYFGLGASYSRISNLVEAARCFGEAKDIYARIPNSEDMASTSAQCQASNLQFTDLDKAREIWMEWQAYDEKHGLLSNRQRKLVCLVLSCRRSWGQPASAETKTICDVMLDKFRQDYPLLNASSGPYDEVDTGYGSNLSEMLTEMDSLISIVANRKPDENIMRYAMIYCRLARLQMNIADIATYTVEPLKLTPLHFILPWMLISALWVYFRSLYKAKFVHPKQITKLRAGSWWNTLEALDLLSKQGAWYVESKIECALRLFKLRKLLFPNMPLKDRNTMTAEVGKWLQRSLDILDEMHDSFNLTGDLETLRRKMNLEQDVARELYSAGVDFCLEQGDMLGAWKWVQKSKSRSLSELISITCQSSAVSMIEALNTDDEVLRLISQEAELLSRSAGGDMEAAKQLVEVRKLMKKHPHVAAVLALRSGQIRTAEDHVDDAQGESAGDAAGIPESATHYIDWFLPRSDSQAIYIFCRSGGDVHFEKISAILPSIAAWIDTYLDFNNPDGSGGSNLNTYVTKDGVDMFAHLQPLVAPLDKWTKGDDLLVLCPSGPLHKLPLHAVKCGKTRLIDRNPVVYVTGLSIHRQCTLRVQSKAKNTTTHKPAFFMGTLGGAIGADDTESEAVGTCLRAASSDFPGETEVLLDTVTRSNFENACQCSEWIHFHCHAQYIEGNAYEQGFALSPSPNDEDYEIYSLKSLFGLQLHANAPHFTTISCSSTLQQYAPGKDDPLGIVSALLLAGAGSTIGCLWPISSRAGRMFTELFYEYLKEQSDDEGKAMLDLADALRCAVRDMKSDREFHQPIHWAGFVLHGGRYAYVPKRE